MPHVVSCPIVFLYDQYWHEGVVVLKVMKIDHFFGVCSGLGNFLRVFGRVNEWLILKVQGMIRMSPFVLCPMNFKLLCDPCQQRGVLILLKKDHFLIFLAIWVIFAKFFKRLMSELH